jgi:hypothetical protein
VEADNGIQNRRQHNMKIFASALVGLSLMIGTVMAAQAPAASSSTSTSTDTTKHATKVKKHKKHAAAKTTAPAADSKVTTQAPASDSKSTTTTTPKAK